MPGLVRRLAPGVTAFMDLLVGIIGALVIANWSYGLIRDTGAILLDMNPDRRLAEDLRKTIESEGDRLSDLPVAFRPRASRRYCLRRHRPTPWPGSMG
jgi:Co/Zn/Cd efflux system component